MKLTYDKEANAAYIYFQSSQKVLRTMPIKNDVVVDFGLQGQILGIEILNASSHLSNEILNLKTPQLAAV